MPNEKARPVALLPGGGGVCISPWRLARTTGDGLDGKNVRDAGQEPGGFSAYRVAPMLKYRNSWWLWPRPSSR